MEQASTSRPATTASRHDENYSNLRQKHDEAFLYIEQGLCCDECGQSEQAVLLYQKGLKCIQKALDISSTMKKSDYTDQKWAKVNAQVNKMNATKRQMQSRINAILTTDAAAARAQQDPPPSYEVATTPLLDIPHDSLLSDNVGGAVVNDAYAHVLLTIDEGVQMFYISPSGSVSAPSYPSKLGIFTLDEPQQAGGGRVATPPAFLKVGDWTYPLIPGRSPALRADWGAYVFPDTEHRGGSVGVIIPDTVSAAERQFLEDTLENLTAFRKQATETYPEAEWSARQDEKTSTVIARGLVSGAEWIASSLRSSAVKGTELLSKGSVKLREKITPDQEEKKVDPGLRQGMYYTKHVAGAAVKVSGYLVNAIGEATMALGREMAPHVKTASDKYLPESLTKKKKVPTATLR